jgi:hypothetical protein
LTRGHLNKFFIFKKIQKKNFSQRKRKRKRNWVVYGHPLGSMAMGVAKPPLGAQGASFFFFFENFFLKLKKKIN